jgi:hypothetical protein
MMMNIADRKQATASADAQRWLENFAAVLTAQDSTAAADLFLPDGLWRDVLAFTWTIQTMSGRAAIEAMLRKTVARTQPKNFNIPSRRTPPRWVTRAGTEAIEALFEFEMSLLSAVDRPDFRLRRDCINWASTR